jgi:DNA polymerase-3 subunit alpha
MKKNTTANACDFTREEESGAVAVRDKAPAVVGGMIAAKTLKFTRKNQQMAFLTLEDLTGSVEVIVFPRQYERYRQFLNDDEKIFVVGTVTLEDEQDGRIICERIVPFDEVPKEVWLQFPTKEAFAEREKELYAILRESAGTDEVCIYVASPKSVKRLGRSWGVRADGQLMERLGAFVGEKNSKLIEKNIEKQA